MRWLILLAMLLIAPTAAHAQYTTIFSDNFDTYAVGSCPPSPWNCTGANQKVTAAQFHSSPNSVVMGSDLTKHAYVYLPTLGVEGAVEAWVRIQNSVTGGGGNYVGIYNSTSDHYFSICLTCGASGGQVNPYCNGVIINTFASPSPLTWVDVRLEYKVDASAGYCKFYVNGSLIYSETGMTYGTSNPPQGFSADDNALGTSYYFDDVVVQNIGVAPTPDHARITIVD